jgi:hypothetical protein
MALDNSPFVIGMSIGRRHGNFVCLYDYLGILNSSEFVDAHRLEGDARQPSYRGSAFRLLGSFCEHRRIPDVRQNTYAAPGVCETSDFFVPAPAHTRQRQNLRDNQSDLCPLAHGYAIHNDRQAVYQYVTRPFANQKLDEVTTVAVFTEFG